MYAWHEEHFGILSTLFLMTSVSFSIAIKGEKQNPNGRPYVAFIYEECGKRLDVIDMPFGLLLLVE